MVGKPVRSQIERRIKNVTHPAGAERTLGARLDQVAVAARNVLKIWYINATFFTDHGEEHARGVIESLDRLLPAAMYPGGQSPNALHPYEAFLLLSAAWLHDTGMVEGSNWLQQQREGRKNERSERPDGCDDPDCPLLSGLPRDRAEEIRVIRRCHHCFSMWAINGDLGRAAGLVEQEASLVGKLARAHNYHADMNKVEQRWNLFGVTVRVRFLASLLRLADAMDMGCWRIPSPHPDLKEMDREAQFHWDLHHLVSSVDPCPLENKITVGITAASDEDAAIVKRYKVKELSEELASTSLVLAQMGVPVLSSVDAQVRIQPGFGHRIHLEEPPRQSPNLPAGHSRILVVDDEPSARKVLEDVLTARPRPNWVVDTAGSRVEAEKYFASRFYDAAVIDVGLERQDYDEQVSLKYATGLFLLKQAPHPNRGVPAVLVSGRVWSPAVFQAFSQLIKEVDADFLEKPRDSDKKARVEFKWELRKKVGEALARNPP